jgi:hypothetical protein
VLVHHPRLKGRVQDGGGDAAHEAPKHVQLIRKGLNLELKKICSQCSSRPRTFTVVISDADSTYPLGSRRLGPSDVGFRHFRYTVEKAGFGGLQVP